MKKPIQRSKFRSLIGLIYYRLKRFYYWHFSGTNFAKQQSQTLLPKTIFRHQTLLRRQLKDVDMWMQENKITNLKIAAQHLNGLIIEPGQTLSYWRQIGCPRQSQGYLPGMILYNGTVKSGIGGGLCQLSNLIYWMTLHTPLTVIERWRHSFDVFPDSNRSQPFGSGATCAYPNIDLQISNNTKQKFQLTLTLTKEHLVGQWLSDQETQFQYRIFEKDHHIKSEFWGAYSRNNQIYRAFIDPQTQREIGEEFITANHAIMMYNPLLQKPEKTPSSQP